MSQARDITDPAALDTSTLTKLLEKLDYAEQRLAEAGAFAKSTQSGRALDIVRRVMGQPGGVEAIYARIGRLEQAGIFAASDWDHPDRLQPGMAANTVRLSAAPEVLLELLSELRLAAVATGDLQHAAVSSEQASHVLTQILALNLGMIFGQFSEAERIHLGKLLPLVESHYRFVAEKIGFGDIFEKLIDEIWRVLAQRPIEVGYVKEMITSVSVYLSRTDTAVDWTLLRGVDRLISALYGPTRGCQEDPGFSVYRERLEAMDPQALRSEALGFARTMDDTGLVSPYHPVFLRFVRESGHDDLVAPALGLSGTGIDGLACYRDLIHALIDEAVWPETPQAVYGLAGMLERGILYGPPLAPALWRQIGLKLSPLSTQRLGGERPGQRPPRVRLLAGVLCMLGQPLGVGQGNNPTCQSARALSMWAGNDPDYLLQLVAWAARDDNIVVRFEGETIASGALAAGPWPLADVDPVSAVTVPHLDAVYQAMGRLCSGRLEDPHRWINPEFHGWWVSHGFAIAVDVASGKLHEFEAFLRRFYACYHPLYNGNSPVIHPQPAGVAITDSAARFLGWHAISIQRVGLDPDGVMRVYFFNPNNDSGQDWGGGVQVSTDGAGERQGESSLPFPAFASRLYLFHYDPNEMGSLEPPDDELKQVVLQAQESWASERV